MLDKVKKIHMIGIKGTGMVSLAKFLYKKGFEVSGSDIVKTFPTDEILNDLGIRPKVFNQDNVTADIDLIIYSTTFGLDNPERQKAGYLDIQQLSYAQALALFFNQSYGISICGSHGKTTTTSLAAYLFNELGYSPTAIVGANIQNYRTNCLVGESDMFILESDEYQNKLQYYEPKVIVVTNIDYDHPDFFQNPKEYDKVFLDFFNKSSIEKIIACIDDEGVKRVIANIDKSKVITYGFDPLADYVISEMKTHDNKIYFKLSSSQNLGDFELKILGQHNILNATAIIALADQYQVDWQQIAICLRQFIGAKRRFEYMGEYKNITIYDDFAHHPTEIEATLQAARQLYPDKKLFCIFSSHTFSRTKGLLSEFGKAFKLANKVIILETYGSGREKEAKDFLTQDLVDEINKNSGNALYIPHIDEAVKFVQDNVNQIDILFTLGAGDTWQIYEKIKKLPTF